MSNIRRRSSSISSINKFNSKPNLVNSHVVKNDKKKLANKPTWDSTTNDLNQLKASQDEIDRRRLSHQSKNIDLVKTEQQRKFQYQQMKKNILKNDPQVQLALLKEILFDDDCLKNMINNKSDNTLKAVQNFFNDQNDNEDDNSSIITNGKRQAKINMTLAPNVKDLDSSTLPVPTDLAKKNLKSNQKIASVKINNINDIVDNYSNDENDHIPVQDENKSNSVLDEKLKKLKNSNDLEKYKQLLELKQKIIESTLQTAVNTNGNNRGLNKKTQHISTQLDTTELNLNDLEECLRILTSNSNENKQNKIKQKDKIEDDTNNSINSTIQNKNQTSTNTFKLFENALNDLENKLIDFEKLIGKQNTNYTSSNQQFSFNNTSTYTLTLIKIISNLIDHIKETAIELNYEKLRTVELNKQLDIHRKLIDGLTNEVLGVKDQNKKLLNGFINQQAKLEAEMEQIKILLRNSLPNQFSHNIQPHRLSAFSVHSQSSLDLNDINSANQQQQRHSAFQHQILQQNIIQQSQPLQNNIILPRPVSCMSSLNTINNVDQSNNNKSSDKFAERLNAMLFNDQLNQSTHYKNSFDNLNVNRSLSNLNTNKQIMNEFNSQIQELSFKNVEAQQKLKQLQLEQKHLSLSNNEMQQTKMNENDQRQTDTMEKLKREQKMLKEQIDLLNRERETAQNELDALVNNNVSVIQASTNQQQSTNENNKNIQCAIMKHLNQINMNEIHHNYDLISSNTPSLSPIRPEKC